MSMLKDRLNKHFATAAVAVAASMGAAHQASAAIVSSGPVNIVIPDNIDGIYMNVVTGATGTTGAVAGWDINPYSAAVGQFNLWGPTTTTWFSAGGVVGGPYNLPAATAIGGPDTGFFRPGGSVNVGLEFALNSSNNLFGFRFVNEANASLVHFGWIRIAAGATAGERAIVEYAYESEAGVSIGAGVVPAPGAAAMFGAAGLLVARRRRSV